MENVCKWCGGPPCGVLIQRQDRQVTFSKQSWSPRSGGGRAPSADGPGQGEDQVAGPVMMALIAAGPKPGIGVFWTPECEPGPLII